MTEEDIKKEKKTFDENPNIFRTFHIERNERRHSSIIAWLLQCKEHGLGNLFSKSLINIINKRYNKNIKENLSFVTYTERHDIDILMVSEEGKIVIVIENKIDTGEHDGQLQKYFKDIEARYKDFDRYYFKLSITGCLPEENIEITREHWQIITYIDILNALKSISKEDINKSKDITKNIVKDFINNLKFCLKVDDSMMLACLKKEKNEFAEEKNELKEAIKESLKSKTTFCTQEKENDNIIKFGTQNMDKFFNRTSLNNEGFSWDENKYAYEFKIDNDKLILQFVVLETKDSDNKVRDLEKFINNPEEQFILRKEGEHWIVCKKREFFFGNKNADELFGFFEDCKRDFSNWEKEICEIDSQSPFNISEDKYRNYKDLFDPLLSLMDAYKNNFTDYLFNKILEKLDAKWRNKELYYFGLDKDNMIKFFPKNDKNFSDWEKNIEQSKCNSCRGRTCQKCKQGKNFWKNNEYTKEIKIENNNLYVQYVQKYGHRKRAKQAAIAFNQQKPIREAEIDGQYVKFNCEKIALKDISSIEDLINKIDNLL